MKLSIVPQLIAGMCLYVFCPSGFGAETFTPDKSVSKLNDAAWANMGKALARDPILLGAVDKKKLLVRVSDTPEAFFTDVDWKAVPTPDADKGAAQVELTVQSKKNGTSAVLALCLGPSANRQIQADMEASFEMFFSCARMSSWSGKLGSKLEIPSATFSAYFEPSRKVPNTVFCTLWNLGVRLGSIRDNDKFTSEDELIELIKRTAVLFDSSNTDKPEVPKEKDIALKVDEHSEGKAVVNWSVGGNAVGYWVRIDTTAGELSQDPAKPGKVTISKLPAEGARVTCCAIAPDGKKRYALTIHVRS